MVKTHMGWMKRTEEKVKKEHEDKKKAQEEQKFRVEQARHAAQLNAMLRAAGVPPGLGKGCWPPGKGCWPPGKGGMDEGKGTGKVMDKGEPKPTPGHKLPRDPVPDLGIIEGTVIEWRGKFGWIKPSEPIKHELAKKHGGKVYVNSSDLVDCTLLQPGDYCQFLLYKDDSGLGAESCSKIESMSQSPESEQNWNSSSEGASNQSAVGNWGEQGPTQTWDASSSAASWEQSLAETWNGSPGPAAWEQSQAQSWSPPAAWAQNQAQSWSASSGPAASQPAVPSWLASTSPQAQSGDASTSQDDQTWKSFLSAVASEPGFAGSHYQ